EAGVPELVHRGGLLYVYPTRADYEAESLAWRLRRDNGLAWTELDTEALHDAVPTLAPRYHFGAFVQAGTYCRDPGLYVAALARRARMIGVRFIGVRATGFDIQQSRL